MVVSTEPKIMIHRETKQSHAPHSAGINAEIMAIPVNNAWPLAP